MRGIVLFSEEKGKYVKAFHDSIIDSIDCAEPAQLGYLGKLIMATKIPDDHVPTVLAAWQKKTGNRAASNPVNANLLARMPEEVTDAGAEMGPTADEICEVRGE